MRIPLCRAIFVFALLLPVHAHALEPRAVLPEHAENAVLAWLLPLEMDKPVTPTWLLRDVGIDRSALQLTLEGPQGRKARATIRHAVDGPDGELLGTARLQCAADLPVEACDGLRQALQKTPRAPSPWLVRQPSTGGRTELETTLPEFAADGRTQEARATLLVLWAALLVLLVVWRLRQRASLRVMALTAALFAVALGLRLWLAPRGQQHEMFHAWESLAFLRGSSRFANGETVPALVTAINALHDFGERSLFAVTLLAASASVVALLWFVELWTADLAMATMAGILLAFLPSHIHFSASEEFAIVSILLTLLSWAAWLDWLRAPTRVALLLAAVSAVLAMQSRPEFVALPLTHLTLALTAQPLAVLKLRLRLPVLWLVTAGALLACWHVPLDMRMRGGFPGFSPQAVDAIVPRLLWLDPKLSSWPMRAWLLVGLAVLLRRETRKGLWLLTWLVVPAVLLLALYVGADAYAWRVQLLSGVLGCVLAAHATELPISWRGLLPTALIVMANSQLMAARPAVQQTSLTDVQYRFERAHTADIPAGADVLAVLSAPIDHPPRLGALRDGQTRTWRDAVDPENTKVLPRETVFVQSAACWLRWPGETRTPTGLHPVCQRVHDAFRLTPIAETDLAPTQEPPLAWAPPGPRGYRIGLYRLTPR